jgi:hypothetical protein
MVDELTTTVTALSKANVPFFGPTRRADGVSIGPVLPYARAREDTRPLLAGPCAGSTRAVLERPWLHIAHKALQRAPT